MGGFKPLVPGTRPPGGGPASPGPAPGPGGPLGGVFRTSQAPTGGGPGESPLGGGAPATGGQNRNNSPAAGSCPPGQQMINGRCRHAGDFPCPPGQCKDVHSGECRSPGRNEKINETDDIERASGGGRGFCKQREAGRGGRGGGASLQDEQAYFDRIVAAGDWTNWPPGSSWYYNDPGNDRSRRVWVNRNTLQLDETGRGYRSIQADAPPGFGTEGPAGHGGGPGGGPGGPGGPQIDLSGDINTQIAEALQRIFQGGETRFSPEVMADITAGQKSLEQAQIQQGTQAANEDAAARGLAFSGVGAAQAGQARSQAQQTFAQGQREARQQKAFYDFEDKMGALGKAQEWLNSLRQYSLGLEQNAIAREQINASILIARERIAADAQQLMQQLNSQRDLLGMQLGSQEWMFMQSQLQCLMNPAGC